MYADTWAKAWVGPGLIMPLISMEFPSHDEQGDVQRMFIRRSDTELWHNYVKEGNEEKFFCTLKVQSEVLGWKDAMKDRTIQTKI